MIKILVADDSSMQRKVIAQCIDEWKKDREVEVVQVENGDQAMVQLRNPGFRLAILDIEMGEPNGIEVAKFSKSKLVPCIMNSSRFTANDSKGYQAECERLGVSGILRKSDIREELPKLLDKVFK